MEQLPKEMNWKAFGDYTASKFDWFNYPLEKFFNSLFKDGETTKYTRIDHILSDIDVHESGEVVINIQDGDPFIEDINTYLSVLNGLIRKKYDCFFSINKVNYI